MCGIVGKVFGDMQKQVDKNLLKTMCQAIVHRGPDDEGIHLDGPVGLGMRRLKVIDLTGGHQPMSNEDGDVWIVFNGEIYNYLELRQRLEQKGHFFKTASDTETILHLYEEKGEECLDDLRGMFAFAIWDTGRQKLFLARDRLGQKPLYYAERNGALIFASELMALMCDKSISRDWDPLAIDEYLTYLFIPHPRTIYRHVKKLPPASYAIYQGGQFEVRRYWEARYEPISERPIEENVEELDALLGEAVELRMRADVPFGAFLSGGLDSSLVTALMQRASTQPIKTFSIGFEDSSFNELKYARQVARLLGTDHEEHIVDYDVRELVPKLVGHFGEPFADSSAIPTYHLSKVTRSRVTVALSGDGGDEVFGGYRRYQARILADYFNRLPSCLGRGMIEWIARQMKESTVYYGKSLRKKVRRFLEFSAAVREVPETSWAFFFMPQEKNALYSEEFTDILNKGPFFPSYQGYWGRQSPDPRQVMLGLDLVTYLPDDILVKVDRMSMACSLETRAPFLDHKVVEFMAGIQRKQKFTLRKSKVLLRAVARKYLPMAILERPKQGFAIPLGKWLQNELRPWLEELLFGQASRERGIFDLDHLRQMVRDHISGRRDYSQQLWALLVLELWFQREEGEM